MPMSCLTKPASIKNDPWRSKKWDELTKGRDFAESDIPTLSLLVQWYQVVDQCMADISTGAGVQVAYTNDMGDQRAMPQLSTMKQASAEIRQLNKQLGINDEAKPERQKKSASVLQLVMGDRERKAAGNDS